MASISNDGGGRRRLLFVDPDGRRKTVRLGKITARAAETVKVRVEALLACRTAGCPWDGDLAAWVRDLGDELADKLAGAGLIPKRDRATLDEFLGAYIDGRSDVKGLLRRSTGTPGGVWWTSSVRRSRFERSLPAMATGGGCG